MTISTISCDLSQYLRRNESIVQIFRIWICCLESYPNEIILEENVIVRSISNKTESYLHSKGYISPHHGTGKFILFYFRYYVTLKSISDSRLTAYLLHVGTSIDTRSWQLSQIPGHQIDNRTYDIRSSHIRRSTAPLFTSTRVPHKFIYPEVIDNVR